MVCEDVDLTRFELGDRGPADRSEMSVRTPSMYGRPDIQKFLFFSVEK